MTALVTAFKIALFGAPLAVFVGLMGWLIWRHVTGRPPRYD